MAYPDIRDVIEKFDFDSQIGRLDAGTTRIAWLSVRASFNAALQDAYRNWPLR